MGNSVAGAQQNVRDINQKAITDQFTNQLNALKLKQLQAALGQPSKDDPAAQIAAMEKALGRPLTESEKETWLQIAPKTTVATQQKTLNVPSGGAVYDPATKTFSYPDATKTSKTGTVDPSTFDANIKAAAAGKVNPPPGDTKEGAAWWAEAEKLGVADKLRTRSFAAGSDAGSGTSLTPQALDAVTDIFIRTGQLPALGLGATAVREKIFNRAGELLNNTGKPSAGAGNQVALNKSAYNALSSTLTKLQQQQAAVNAFESTALKNLDMFEDKAKPIIDKGSPWINAPLRTVSLQGFGNADLAAANVARNVALTEISRVLSNPNLTGVLSDEARNQVSSLIGPNASLKMIYSAADVLRQDMGNRKQSIADEISQLRDQLGGKGAPGGGQSQQAPGAPPPGSQVIELGDFLKAPKAKGN